MHRLLRLIFLLPLAVFVAGCGGEEAPETASLTGEVKRMNGEPVGDVTVVFYPATGPSAVAQTDDAGKFTAEVPVGEARVAIVAGGEAPTDTSPEALEAMAAAEAKSKVNPRFAVPESSGLSVTVKPTQEEPVVFVVE
ncbi:MAG: carboxypeptidase-like regulatory domain-containing protein [Planctomycetes bacterium]|nr:carboxypeptidase-like regulatory domain-containing protein [Planctomycetota bacterium]